jgi:hypothetical protein
MPTHVEYRKDEANETNIDIKLKGIFIDVLDKREEPIPDFPDLQVFSTPNGQRIITPKSAILDDEVWILYGASRPVILRPEDDVYGFLCEALVYNEDGNMSEIMFGHAVEEVSQGNAETRKIWLV